ncbi:MAG TPA: hypothetical protein PKD24_14475 [Pyrinomonadaceae bacterium]|nr:hypothetical protein [Pyrinomonadaceae bacterium]HMP66246.1 hypothetical protein [Pyrinomonadaceae bacterium]
MKETSYFPNPNRDPFRRILSSLVIFLLVGLLVGSALAQESRSITRTVGSTVVLKTFTEIPEATEPCTPEECEWWERLRSTGNELQRKGDKKSTRRFVLLLVEGMERSYRVPLPDRPATTLHAPRPAPMPPGVRMRNGTVKLSVEFAAEGSIGEVRLLSGIRSDMDQRCVQSVRDTIFLPAVKDRRFVTEWSEASCGFHSSSGTR